LTRVLHLTDEKLELQGDEKHAHEDMHIYSISTKLHEAEAIAWSFLSPKTQFDV
jgi:hypothetical protein